MRTDRKAGNLKRLASAVLAAGAALVFTAGDVMTPILDTALPTLEAQSRHCSVTAQFYNTRRRVKGTLDQECHWPHSPPWGNWGVDSNYGRRQDSFQWAGWKRKSGNNWRQWSACTVKREYAPPNPEYYNDNGNRTQKADPDNSREHAWHRWRWGPGRTCDRSFGNVYVFRSNYMDLYELDDGGIFGGGDDYVTTLKFGNVSVPISCSDDWNCSGRSRWRSSRSNSNASARLRIRVTTRRAG